MSANRSSLESAIEGSDARAELFKAQRQAQSLRAELLRSKNHNQSLSDELELTQKRLSLLMEVKQHDIRPQDLKPPKLSKSAGSGAAIICCSDWHVEQRVRPSKINGLNEFDPTICERRVNQLWERSLRLLDSNRRLTKIKHGVLWLGGDFITGHIHEELQESNYMCPAEAIVFATQLIMDGINHLVKHAGFDRLEVICNYGNHGRTTKKKRVSTGAETSFEWLMYQQLSTLPYWNNRVRWIIAEGEQVIHPIMGHLFRFQHGDAIKYQGGVGGITIPVNKAIASWNRARPVAYDIFGHWHQWKSDYAWGANCSLIGYDEFAQHIKADYQEPSQTFIVTDRERGVVTNQRIFVDKSRVKSEAVAA